MPTEEESMEGYLTVVEWALKEGHVKEKLKRDEIKMTEINLIHREVTDEEMYTNIKKSYKENPEVTLHPKEWKEQRLKLLQKEGRNWSY